MTRGGPMSIGKCATSLRAIGGRASLWCGAAGLLLLLLGAGWCDAADEHGRDLFDGAGVAGFFGFVPPLVTFTLATNVPSYLPGGLHELSASLSTNSTTAV